MNMNFIELQNIIQSSKIIFLPFQTHRELSSNININCLKEMKRKYNGKTYISYGFNFNGNKIELSDDKKEIDGYLLISKRDIRTIPTYQRKCKKEIESYAKVEVQKFLNNINVLNK